MTEARIIALPTKYAGIQFRSRLEARWAVFFDALKIKWEYEPEGFKLDDFDRMSSESCYEPDFLVRTPQNKDMWLEIKPHHITQNDKFDKFKKLISCSRVTLLSGQPEDVLDERTVCPRCGDFYFPLNQYSTFEKRFYCYPCDMETPCGGGHEIQKDGFLGCAYKPHKGDIIVSDEDFILMDISIRDAAEKARIYRFPK